MFPTFVIADLIRDPAFFGIDCKREPRIKSGVTMIGETAFGPAPPYASRNNGQCSGHFFDLKRSS